MATKKCCSSLFTDNRDIIVTDTGKGQYSNLNLNQNHCSSSYSLSGGSENVIAQKGKGTVSSTKLSDFANNDELQAKQNSPLWNKSNKDLPPNFGNKNDYGSEKEDKLKEEKNSCANNSTLSLHIAAYENSVEDSSGLFDGTKEVIQQDNEDLTKKCENAKQIFIDSRSVIQKPFEFPRQQESDEAKMPEVAQYRASQRLLHHNEVNQVNYQQPLPQDAETTLTYSDESPKKMSATTDTNQVNFNPAWMQTTPLRIDKGSFHRGSDSDDLSKTEMIAPVFAKHRYGREDILAMMQKSTRPPDGLRKCQFFVEEGQLPIILSILNETEMRLQQNINSSKALSLLTHQERQAINGNGSNSQPSSPWATANSNKTAKPGSRWSALTSNDSPSGGSGYVKAGMPRGGGTVLGRGGGIVGNSTRGRFDSSRGGFTAGARSRLRSNSDDDPANAGWTTVGTKTKDESSIWRNTGKTEPADSMDASVNRFASSETNGGFHRSGRGGLTASTASRGGSRIGADRFEPDYKRSESHDPTNDWGRQVSPDFHMNKGIDRINLSHSPPTKAEDQYNSENNYSRQESANTSKLVNERQVNDNDPLQQFLNTITSSSSPPTEADTWYYLDPQGGQHGPYETTQMLIWYNSKFFREDLKCTRNLNQQFTTLGDLIQKNGRETPFIFPKNEPIMQPVLENAWRSPHPHEYYESQRAMMEEKRRLEEKQEALRREEMERLERERRVREMEVEIQRKQEELMKVATEREEELERKRRQLAEYEQKAKQEAERRLAEQRAKEASDARRIQEQMERERQEYEEQQRKQEEEFRRRQRQVAEEAAHLREQAMIEARKVAEEAERQRQEKAEHERRQNEERLKYEHLKQLAEAQKRREAEEAAAKAAVAAARVAATAKAPWTAPNINKDKPHILQTQRSLLEIQLEEEKALEEKRRKEAELFEIQRKQTATKPTGPWSGTTITSTVVSKAVWGSDSNKSPVNPRAAAPTISNSAWPAMPTPATPPPKKEAPKQQPKQNAQKKQSDPKKENNEFQKWAIKAIKDLNKSVDATVDPEMFFGFIESVIDPVDVEDYFVTYFGESDAVKEFQKKFLEKRIALRPKQKKNDKDDLSAAQSALNPSQDFEAGGKKKKKGKGPVKTVDLTVLGFKAGGDPNRINAGEIDTAPPVSMKKRR